MDIDDEREIVELLPIPGKKRRKNRKAKKVKKMASLELPTVVSGGNDNSALIAAMMGNHGGTGAAVGGGLGAGLLGGVLGGLLFNRDGRGGVFGGEGGGGAAVSLQNSIDTSTIMTALGNIQAAVPLAESQVQLALAGVSSDITSQSLQQTIALQNQGFQAQLAAQAGFNSVGDKVDNLAAANALAIATNQFNCVNATQVDGEKTRALINSVNEANLNRIITTQAAEIAALQNEGSRAADRHGVEVTMINNQNQNQMQFQQQAQVLGNLSNGLVQALQSIHATNQAINIGGGTQTANPTNTNTNVRA